MGDDALLDDKEYLVLLFQSTSPAWGTTAAPPLKGGCAFDFNPRPPHGGRQQIYRKSHRAKRFQSTSPHGGRPDCSSNSKRIYDFNPRPPHGGRLMSEQKRRKSTRFQSTSPVRGTTRNSDGALGMLNISIHVPRAGDDEACRRKSR